VACGGHDLERRFPTCFRRIGRSQACAGARAGLGPAVSGAEGAGDGGAEPGPRPSARLRPADPPEAGGEASFEVMASAGYR
ncbi:hypothetical protein, partial [Streptomyces sp. MBT97]|uniref:hypothetical protein n=1 Tax=Streptomyces sp. MBT97 TaxID=2800411 RepID=UPI001F32D196